MQYGRPIMATVFCDQCCEDVFGIILNFAPPSTQMTIALSHNETMRWVKRNLAIKTPQLQSLASLSPRRLANLVERNHTLRQPYMIVCLAWRLLWRANSPLRFHEQTRITVLLFVLLKHYPKTFRAHEALLHGLFVYARRFEFLSFYRDCLFAVASPNLRCRWRSYCNVVTL